MVVARHLSKHVPCFVKPKQLARELSADGKYVVAGSYEDYDFYVASGLNCPLKRAGR